jgi:catechol 2,3-dioxygenase-like lactoylglutathione lyase family enzyme
MALQDCLVGAMVPVSDMTRAKEFYEGTLGLSNGDQEPDGGLTYHCAEGSRVHVYPSPEGGGKSGATVAGFRMDDIKPTVDELSSKGVTFEQYDMEELKTNESGIAEFDDGGRVAWFKDPDGNLLAVFND